MEGGMATINIHPRFGEGYSSYVSKEVYCSMNF